MIFSLTGLPGSGKTTVVKLLAEQLDIPWYSMGDIRGKMAQEQGLTLDELNAKSASDPTIDHAIDTYQTQLGASGASFIIDGRLAWHFIAHSFKVFLDVDPHIAAQRIFDVVNAGKRQDEQPFDSVEQAQTEITRRTEADRDRYRTAYHVDFLDRTHYDLVIDTTHISAEEVARRIIDASKNQSSV